MKASAPRIWKGGTAFTVRTNWPACLKTRLRQYTVDFGVYFDCEESLPYGRPRRFLAAPYFEILICTMSLYLATLARETHYCINIDVQAHHLVLMAQTCGC